MQQIEDVTGGDFEPDMPDPGAAAYLLDHFWAVGPTLGDQMLTQGELRYYQENTGVRLTPWECSTLRRLSGEYLSESHKARDAKCPPPFADSTDAKRLLRAQVRGRLASFLD